MSMQRTQQRFRTASIAGLAWLIALILLAPYLQMFVTALKPPTELFTTPPDYLPQEWTWRNFVDVWSASNIATNFRVSLIVSAFSTLLVLTLALPAAYYTARNNYRGRGLFLILVLATKVFAPAALVIGIYRQFVELGLVNTYLALILVNSAFNLAFGTWILTAYFASIPRELEEAAWIDGCGRLQGLFRIAVPLARPGVVTAAIYTFVASWNEFIVALTLAGTRERQPLTVGLTNFVSEYTVQWQFLFAASLMGIIPVVFLFILIERHLVHGLTAGGVK